MKNFKTFYKTLTASRLKEIRESFTPPPPPSTTTTTRSTLPTSLEQIFSYGDTQEYIEYTDICFPKALRRKFVDLVSWTLLREYIFFNVELVEVLLRLTMVADICAQPLPSLHPKKASYVPKIAKCDMQLVGLF